MNNQTMNKQYTQSQWQLKTEIKNTVFENYDFTETDFNQAVFKGVSFINCLFERSKLAGTRVYEQSNFINCQFKSVNLRNSTFGSGNGYYQNCQFEKCGLSALFNGSQFIASCFINCKMKNISFNDSTFVDCQFIGKLDDVTFNGIYQTSDDPDCCLNNVDFSQAQFGEFVSFYHCNLSSCLPPKGKTFAELLYPIYVNDPTVQRTGSKDKITLTRQVK